MWSVLTWRRCARKRRATPSSSRQDSRTSSTRSTADRFKQGVSSELDTNRAKQQVNSLEQQRQEAEYSYIAAKLNLAQLLQANITPTSKSRIRRLTVRGKPWIAKLRSRPH